MSRSNSNRSGVAPAQGLGELILLTGATGFIGGHVLASLIEQGAKVRILSRRPLDYPDCVIGDLLDADVVRRALEGVHTVIHAAGYAHAFDSLDTAQTALHEANNHLATQNLAALAASAGVRRFVLCSTVKAVGEPGTSCVDEAFDAPAEGPYGVAKWKAERALMAISQGNPALQAVVLRFAMVYGPGGRGNLERMMRLVARGVFPPLPETGNRRSMVFVDDAVEAILLAASHPSAAGGTFIVAHPEAPSGREIYQTMRRVCGKAPGRRAVPVVLLRGIGRFADRLASLFRRRLPVDSQTMSRLLDSAWYSSQLIQSRLGWRPVTTLADGLARTWQASHATSTTLTDRPRYVA